MRMQEPTEPELGEVASVAEVVAEFAGEVAVEQLISDHGCMCCV